MNKKALILILRKTFPIVRYTKGLSLEELAESAGNQNVIDYIERMEDNARLR